MIRLIKTSCSGGRRFACSRVILTLATVALFAGTCQLASAATLCVNPGGESGCYSTIGKAVSVANAYDTINVAQGTYKESVTIAMPLSLIGENPRNTIIDASGQSNGINIDGLDHAGLKDVVVAGFTVENANFEGILVTNASSVTISDNRVLHNNLSLIASAAECPDIPAFETAEGFDCGEGVHLTGVDHSIVANNTIENNSGGILLSDETGATHDNLIAGNLAKNNPFDCGITLASHPVAGAPPGTPSYGVFYNTISGNESSKNGLAVEGAGAGVGIFDPGPGTKNYGNKVINNRLIGNGLPGVTFHSHAPFQIFQDHLVTGNYISGNGKDTADAATSGPTGINIYVFSTPPPGGGTGTGIVISQNVIEDEAIDVAVKTPATAEVQVHLNNFDEHTTGVDNLGPGTVNATENWWGCRKGPGADGCATVATVTGAGAVLFNPWLTNRPETDLGNDNEY
jgi:parallel beta-helix repeat protein